MVHLKTYFVPAWHRRSGVGHCTDPSLLLVCMWKWENETGSLVFHLLGFLTRCCWAFNNEPVGTPLWPRVRVTQRSFYTRWRLFSGRPVTFSLSLDQLSVHWLKVHCHSLDSNSPTQKNQMNSYWKWVTRYSSLHFVHWHLIWLQWWTENKKEDPFVSFSDGSGKA